MSCFPKIHNKSGIHEPQQPEKSMTKLIKINENLIEQLKLKDEQLAKKDEQIKSKDEEIRYLKTILQEIHKQKESLQRQIFNIPIEIYNLRKENEILKYRAKEETKKNNLKIQYKINDEEINQKNLSKSPILRNKMTFEKQKIIGLPNIGNSCYMNSALQCLINTEELSHYFLGGEYKKDLNQKSSKTELKLATKYAEFLVKIWNENNASEDDLAELKKNIVGNYLNKKSNSQEDCNDFLLTFLNGLHQDLNRNEDPKDLKNLNSKIADIFNIGTKSIIECSNCPYKYERYENTFFLPISLTSENDENERKSIDLESNFKKLFETEKMQMACPDCKMRSLCKMNKILKFPKTLIFQLQRFQFNGSIYVKSDVKVDFPFNLFDLEEFSESKMVPEYELYAVCNHTGSKYGGHYFTYSKIKELKKWFIFNDSRCNEISETKIRDNSAYILLYELKN